MSYKYSFEIKHVHHYNLRLKLKEMIWIEINHNFTPGHTNAKTAKDAYLT